MVFPRGFITPKVGPHQSYGLAPGTVFGKKAELKIVPEGLSISNPSLEHIVAVTQNKKSILIVLLNQHHQVQTGKVDLDISKFDMERIPKHVKLIDHEGKLKNEFQTDNNWEVTVSPYGLTVLELGLE